MLKKVLILLLGGLIWGTPSNNGTKINYVYLPLNEGNHYRYLNIPKVKVEKTKVEVTLEEENKKDLSIEQITYQNNLTELMQVKDLTNALRKEAQKEALIFDEELSLLATKRALEIAESKYFEHLRPTGEKVETILQEARYNYHAFGENIAKGYNTPYEVVEAWHNSWGHYQNMLKTNFKKIGLGKAQIDHKVYWVQFFTD